MKRSIIGVAVVTIIGLGVVGVLNIKGQPQVADPGAHLTEELSPKGMLSISSEPIYRDGQLAIVNPETSKTKGKKEELLRLGVLKGGKLVPVMLKGEMLLPDSESEGGEPGLILITKIAPLGISKKGNVIAQSRGAVMGVIETNGKVLLLGAKQGNKVVPLKMQADKKLKALGGSEAGIIGDCGQPVDVMVNINNNFYPLEVNAKGIVIQNLAKSK